MFTCPKCGDDTERLHEGYCFKCCESGQSALDDHNARFDAWERMTDSQREHAIKGAI